MTDQATLPNANEPPILSVSELSGAVKRIVEDQFGFVRMRGEISGFKRAASGHMYMTLKDADAAIDGWRGSAAKLDIQPEDGLEVIVSGRVTTYPSRSKYQFVIERMELAGEGALLRMIEERRKKLAAEGLFDEGRKREFLGWLSAGASKFSASRAFLSALRPGHRFRFSTTTHGSRRAIVPIGLYESVLPMDLLPTPLLRALVMHDVERAEELALCTFVCPSKIDYGASLRGVLNTLEAEG